MNTAHVSTFVLISILRGLPMTPPSGENLGALDYHLNRSNWESVSVSDETLTLMRG